MRIKKRLIFTTQKFFTRQELWYVQLSAAKYFAAESLRRGKYYDNEDKLSNLTSYQKSREKHAYRSNIIGAIYTSVASLETSINEFFLDAVASTKIQSNSVIPFFSVLPLKPDLVEEIARNWPNVERRSTLSKYDKALELSNQPKIQKSDHKRESVEALIKFRHKLTHPKPEWVDAQARNKDSLRAEKNDLDLENRIKALINLTTKDRVWAIVTNFLS